MGDVGGGSVGGGGGGSAADAYIGSLISLTSKSEIRYEGILYTVDTENSNIALQDVRSFGTEGRKKEGLQIPPSDKIYDYIIFRGSDIKDLQVKLSPPIQPPEAHPHHDPAIISLQSQFSQPAPVASSFVPTAAGNIPSGGNQGPYPGIISAAYGHNLPSLYPPGQGLGSWALPAASPGANAALAVPMYWQGFYRPPSGIPHLQQHSQMPFQPSSTLTATYLAQGQSLSQQQPSLPLSLTTALPAPAATLVTAIQQPNLSLTSLKESLVTAAISSDILTSSTALPALSPAIPQVEPLADSILTSTSEEKISSMRTEVDWPQKVDHSISQALDSFLVQGTSQLSTSGVPPTLLAPSQLLQPAMPSAPMKSSVATTQSLTLEQTLMEPSMTTPPFISAQSSSQAQKTTDEPLLPLPPSPVNPPLQKQLNQANGYLRNASYIRRGRGRDRGIWVSQSQKQFTEDFDFTAMNEKFNKDEVWGELGRGDSRDRGDGEEGAAEDGHTEEDPPRMPVYVKDDFFDTLSCDALTKGGQIGRTKFSEQRKIDTETFGTVRSRSGRGGRGGYRGGFRGSYYGGRGGRGGGNNGRGWSVSRSPAAF